MSPKLEALLQELRGGDWDASPPDWDEIIRLGLEEGWSEEVSLSTTQRCRRITVKEAIGYACNLGIQPSTDGHYPTGLREISGNLSMTIHSTGWEPVFDIIAERCAATREMAEIITA